MPVRRNSEHRVCVATDPAAMAERGDCPCNPNRKD